MKLIKTAGYEKVAQGFGALEGGLPSQGINPQVNPQMGHSELAEAMDSLVAIVDMALKSPSAELHQVTAEIPELKQKLSQLVSKML